MEENQKKFKVYESGFEEYRYSLFDEKEMKEYLKHELQANVNLNILLGSGSSLPAINVMKTTFEDLKKSIEKLDLVVKKYLDSSVSHDDPNAEDIELFLSWLGNRINGLSDKELSLGERDVNQAVKDGFIKSIVDGFRGDKSISTSEVYNEFFRNLSRLKGSSDDQHDIINVFTPNYDLFVEQALDKLGYVYTDGFKNSFLPVFDITEYNRRPIDITKRFRDKWSVVKPFFRVYKLHGSLSWSKSEVTGYVVKAMAIEKRKLAEFQDAVIAPTSSKYADSQGSPFSDLFREFSIELTKPNTVLLINGYGFGDDHINNFIFQALGRSDFKVIAFVEEKTKDGNTKAYEFMKKVGASTRATFVTSNILGDGAFHFSTLAQLLWFPDPMVDEKNMENHNGKQH